jgi:hypothetical protein
MLLSTLLTLSNIAVLPDWHDEFYPALHSLYNLVDSGSPHVKLQALKLLVNLSCNEDMVPSLLAAQVSLEYCHPCLIFIPTYTPCTMLGIHTMWL